MALFNKYLVIELVDGSKKVAANYNVSLLPELDNSLGIIDDIIQIINSYNSLLLENDTELIFVKALRNKLYNGHRDKKVIPSLTVDFYGYLSEKYPDEDFDYDFGGIIEIDKDFYSKDCTRIIIDFKKAKVNISPKKVSLESYKKEHKDTDLSNISEFPCDIENIPIIELDTIKLFFTENHNDVFKIKNEYYIL